MLESLEKFIALSVRRFLSTAEAKVVDLFMQPYQKNKAIQLAYLGNFFKMCQSLLSSGVLITLVVMSRPYQIDKPGKTKIFFFQILTICIQY